MLSRMVLSEVDPSAPPSATREELIELVTKAHLGSADGASSLAGESLAARSRLPRVIAFNLGAGLGQWEFFPDVAEIVDFACAYVPPANEEELYALARRWASDDATVRPTVLALVGREILQHELRRIDVAPLRALVEEARPARALALRTSLGFPVRPSTPPTTGKRAPVRKATPAPKAPPVVTEGGLARMPKPAFVAPKRVPLPPARRFRHPTFGEGVLERQDGVGPESKLTIKFQGGSKTLLARFVTEIPP
jgi:hypothetical protein